MPSRYTYSLPVHNVLYGVMLPVAVLKVDPAAQRTLNQTRAKGIFKNLVKEALGTLIVSKRANGDYYVVDGLHRKAVCEMAGIKDIACEVHEGLDQQEEAILFLIKNRESSKPNALDEYNVGLTARLPLFSDTEAVLKAHGLAMGNSTANTIGAIAGVLKVTENYGPEILHRAITVAEAAWGRTAKTWDGMLLGGLGKLIGTHESIIEDKLLASKLGKFPPQTWIGKINNAASLGGVQHTGTMGRVTAAYWIFLQAWNSGLRSAAKRIAA